MTGTIAVETNAENLISGTDEDDLFYLTLPGSRTVIGGDGNDFVERGAQFTAADRIDLGTGSDTLRLDGDYSAGVDFGPDTLRNVETITLAAGHSYRLAPNDETVAPGRTLTIDGSALGAGDSLGVIGWGETDGNFVLRGGAGADTLIGGAGNDTLDGGGVDVMIGGAGNDTDFVDDLRDLVIEFAEDGTDTVSSTIGYTLLDNVENLTLLGTASWGTGNALDNVITGNAADNLLQGGDGNDILTGGAGDDTLDGGAGFDITAFSGRYHDYTITRSGEDTFVQGSDGRDLLRNIETLRFADGTVSLSGSLPPFNQAPVAVDDSAATLEGAPVAIAVLANDRDADGDPLSIVAVTDGAHGTVAVNPDGTVTYTPAAGFHGSDGFTYTVSDGYGGTATGGVTMAVAPRPSPPDGILHPQVIAPHQPGDIVGLRLTNTAAHAQAPEFVTFGQVFAAGDVRPGDSLVARIDGHDVAVQMDVKATNSDGSVRHALLTFESPGLPAGGAAEVMLAKGGPAADGAAVTAGDILAHGYDLKLALTLHNDDGTASPVTLDAARLLQEAAAGGQLETWMQGAQASEFRVSASINEHLRAVFDIRGYADGTVRTDVSVANDGSFTPGIRTYTYDAAVTGGGRILFSDPGIAHHRNATWHHEVWSGDTPHDFVAYDVDYLVKTGAIPAFDTTAGINSAVLDSDLAAIRAADTGPMGSGTVFTYMPSTGGRDDLGPVTTWAARYLLSQDPRAAEVMLANADASGSVPWHFRDEATGQPLTVDEHPYLWLDERGANWPDPLPDHVAVMRQDTGWTTDISHEPALNYVPYLVTGSHYRLDELLSQASYDLAALYPTARGFGAGIMEVGTTRGTAWGLRDLADAAYVTPDDHPMKGYFDSKLTGSLDHLVEEYITDDAMHDAGAVKGWLPAMPGRAPGFGTAWQDDYLAYSLGTIAQRGWHQAGQMLGWQENYIAGRFINGEDGFNPCLGTVYYIGLGDPDTGTPFDS